MRVPRDRPVEGGSGPRLRRGLPRGGIGYLGVALGIGAVAVALRGRHPWPIVASFIAAPLCSWFGLGLRADGDDGEVTEQVTFEGRRRHDWLDTQDHEVSEFRVSTAIILMGVVGCVIALYRLRYPD